MKKKEIIKGVENLELKRTALLDAVFQEILIEEEKIHEKLKEFNLLRNNIYHLRDNVKHLQSKKNLICKEIEEEINELIWIPINKKDLKTYLLKNPQKDAVLNPAIRINKKIYAPSIHDDTIHFTSYLFEALELNLNDFANDKEPLPEDEPLFIHYDMKSVCDLRDGYSEFIKRRNYQRLFRKVREVFSSP